MARTSGTLCGNNHAKINPSWLLERLEIERLLFLNGPAKNSKCVLSPRHEKGTFVVLMNVPNAIKLSGVQTPRARRAKQGRAGNPWKPNRSPLLGAAGSRPFPLLKDRPNGGIRRNVAIDTAAAVPLARVELGKGLKREREVMQRVRQ